MVLIKPFTWIRRLHRKKKHTSNHEENVIEQLDRLANLDSFPVRCSKRNLNLATCLSLGTKAWGSQRRGQSLEIGQPPPLHVNSISYAQAMHHRIMESQVREPFWNDLFRLYKTSKTILNDRAHCRQIRDARMTTAKWSLNKSPYVLLSSMDRL